MRYKTIRKYAAALLYAFLLCLFAQAFAAPCFPTVTAYASDPADPGAPPDPTDPADPADPVEEDNSIVGAMIDEVFGVGVDNGTIFDPIDSLENAIDAIVLVLEGGTDADGTAMTGLLNEPLYYAFMGVSITIMIISTLTSFVSTEVTTQQFGRATYETVLKPIVKLVVAMMFVINVWVFLKLFLYLSQLAFYFVKDTEISGSLSFGNATVKQMIYDMVGYKVGTTKPLEIISNIVASISMIVAFLIPWAVSLANSAAMIFIVFSRSLNICVRGVMAPLAMTDICSERPIRDTRAWSYIMEFCGLSFQSVAIMIALIATNSIMGAFVKTLSDSLAGGVTSLGQLVNLGMTMAALKIAQIGVMLGTGNLAKRIFAGS